MRLLPALLPALILGAPLLAGLRPGDPLPSFALRGVDGRVVESKALQGPVLVIFMSTQCPAVRATEGRFIALARAYAGRVAVVGINANETDSEWGKDENLEGMKQRQRAMNYPFPYVKDETQAIVKAFGALCTPDFFLFDRQGRLAYHGRLSGDPRTRPRVLGDDGGGREADVTRPELKEAVEALLAGRSAPEAKPSRGCTIKWRKAQGA